MTAPNSVKFIQHNEMLYCTVAQFLCSDTIFLYGMNQISLFA